MNLLEVTNAANAFTDESFETNITIFYANEGIAFINARIGSNLPPFTATGNYTALSDDFIRLLIIPYVSYSIKRNDASVGEADRFFSNFLIGLGELESRKSDAIAKAFQPEGFGGAYQINTEDAINVGWFLNRKTDKFFGIVEDYDDEE
jgi:hypothetical protein